MATLATPDQEMVAAVHHDHAAPTSRRIETLDVVRGVALFGILLMNITGFGIPASYSNPTNWGGAEGANLWSWIITQVGFEGTQRGLFSILFGAGVILFTARLEAAGRTDTADIYFRRNLLLVGFGLFNAFILLWGGDILFYYGVTALFIYVFRNLPPHKLLIIGVGGLLLGMAWNANDNRQLLNLHDDYRAASAAKASGATLTLEQTKNIEQWEAKLKEHKPPREELVERIKTRTAGYGPAFFRQAEHMPEAEAWGLYRYFFDVFGMMIIGMALFKWGVLTLERPTRLYLGMMLGGYAVGLTTNVMETRWIMSHDFSLLAYSQADITYDLGRLTMTVGHLGALLLFVRSGVLPTLRHSLAAVGRMAFTNYLMHSLICLILFVLLGWYGALERHQLYYVVFAIWAGQLIVSPIWLQHYRFGPMEWLWRYMTYGSRPAMRRAPASGAAVAAA